MAVMIDPPEVVQLLWWASRNGFTTHIVGEVTGPSALVLVKHARGYVDIAHLRGPDRTEVARVPRDEHTNVWCPTLVTFHFYGAVVESLAALRHLSAPDAEIAPGVAYPPPRDGAPPPLTITTAERGTVTIRPPARVEDRSGCALRLR